VYEARDNSPDFSTFRCEACMRTEKFVFEN
jgi:hypothetical protein